jgi:hypothetical protein
MTARLEHKDVLVTATACSTLYLTSGLPPVEVVNVNETWCIRDAFGAFAGDLAASSSLLGSATINATGYLFVLLSELEMMSLERLNRYRRQPIAEDLITEWPARLLNVMLVEKRSETTVSRLAIGWVTEAAWKASKPQPYLLQLE